MAVIVIRIVTDGGRHGKEVIRYPHELLEGVSGLTNDLEKSRLTFCNERCRSSYDMFQFFERRKSREGNRSRTRENRPRRRPRAKEKLTEAIVVLPLDGGGGVGRGADDPPPAPRIAEAGRCPRRQICQPPSPLPVLEGALLIVGHRLPGEGRDEEDGRDAINDVQRHRRRDRRPPRPRVGCHPSPPPSSVGMAARGPRSHGPNEERRRCDV